MKRDDMKGAIAAAKYYTQNLTYMYATNEYAELEAMASSKCKFCAGQIRNAKDAAAAGLTRVGMTFTVGSVEHDETWHENHHTFVVQQRVSVAPWKEYNKSGEVVDSDDSIETGYFLYNLYREDGSWRVMYVSLESEDEFRAKDDD